MVHAINPPIRQTQSDPIITLNLPIATKLSHTIFLTWKSQILPVIYGYNLRRYIEPASTGTVAVGTGTVSATTLVANTDLTTAGAILVCQDQLLFAWIRSSLTEPIQAQVVSYSRTADLWTSLTQIFTATSRARLTDLRRQLQSTTKGTLSCSEYLQRMRQIFDELAFIGAPLSDDDLVSFVLNGLGVEYNPFLIAVITASRHSPLTFADVHSLLLSHESLLQGQSAPSSLPFNNFFVNVVCLGLDGGEYELCLQRVQMLWIRLERADPRWIRLE